MKKILKRTGIVVLILFILLSCGILYYLTSYSTSTVSISDYENRNPEIHITREDNGIFIDNHASDDLLVFYPGAKIKISSYIPLLYSISENNIDCFIVEMPFNLAVFDMTAYEKVYEIYKPEYAFLMGHSLGGAMAARYVSAHTDTISGLILLAAYSDQDLSVSGVPVLSIYGSLDGVLNIAEYEKDKENLPDNFTEIIIKGGNHAGFGNYGEQKGDNNAQISREEQQEITERAVTDFINQITQNQEEGR